METLWGESRVPADSLLGLWDSGITIEFSWELWQFLFNISLSEADENMWNALTYFTQKKIWTWTYFIYNETAEAQIFRKPMNTCVQNLALIFLVFESVFGLVNVNQRWFPSAHSPFAWFCLLAPLHSDTKWFAFLWDPSHATVNIHNADLPKLV